MIDPHLVRRPASPGPSAAGTGVRRRSRVFAAALLLAGACTLGACSHDAPEKSAADSTKAAAPHPRNDIATIPADTTVSQNLPPGRYHIPTRHTPAPDFFITLPQGYMVKSSSRMPNDEYFIVRTDDPSLTDSAAVTPAFLRVYVGVKSQASAPVGPTVTHHAVRLGTQPVTWNEWSDKLPDGKPYYMREIASSDFFASISPELARAPLNLQVYVGGRDKQRVDELVKAAETLSFNP